MSNEDNITPPGCEIYTEAGKTCIKYHGRDMVTRYSGTKRSFRGDDDAARRRAIKAMNRWIADEGNEREKYKLADMDSAKWNGFV